MHMLRSCCLFAALSLLWVGESCAQTIAVEVANLREDVRLLVQRTGELQLRVEQLERENSELRAQTAGANKGYATVAQLNEAISDLNRVAKAAAADSKAETLQQVSVQMEKLGRQMNAALDQSDRGRSPVSAPVTFNDNYPKEGIKYVVAKGDTLAVIAKKTGAKQTDIINANRISDPSRIVIGQTLFIPGGK